MKHFFPKLLLLCFSIFLVNCSDDDSDDDNNDAACIQADWVGTYTGTCGNQTVTLDINADGSNNISFTIDAIGSISQTSTSGDLVYQTDGCTAFYDGDGGLDATLTMVLNGNSIAITSTDGSFNPLGDCSNAATLTK
jgi:hypothetical protein